jgi:hypothetical protein
VVLGSVVDLRLVHYVRSSAGLNQAVDGIPPLGLAAYCGFRHRHAMTGRLCTSTPACCHGTGRAVRLSRTDGASAAVSAIQQLELRPIADKAESADVELADHPPTHGACARFAGTGLDQPSGSIVPVRGREQRSFGRRRDRGVVRLTGREAGSVLGGTDPCKMASGQSRCSGAEPGRVHSVCTSTPVVDGRPDVTSSRSMAGAVPVVVP